MKYTFSILILFAALAGCKKEETPQPGDNLVINGSFEDNGSFSLDGWTDNNTASNTDVPSGGGNFSLKITPASSPAEGYADYEITDITGTKNFKLTCYIKASGDWPGSVTLRKIDTDGNTTVLGSEATSENAWTSKSIEITTTMATGDKLVVHLSAGSTEAGAPDQYALFDLVELKEVD